MTSSLSAKNNKLGVAIIGAGLIGQKRASAVKGLEGFILTGIFDINKQAANNFANTHGCSVYESIEQILTDSSIDLVILAIVHKEAAALAPKILKSKNLLLEKPVGRNLKETREIIRAAKKGGHKLFGGFNYRFYPHVVLLKKYLSEGRLGKIISSSFKIGHAAFPGYEKTWKMDKELCGGGVILDPGIHLIDLMIFFLGVPKDKAIYKNSLGWQTQVEDEAFLIFKYPDGSLANHHYSLNLSQNTFEIEVVGSKAVAKVWGRTGNYGQMKFLLTPRWHWKTKQKIVSRDFVDRDDSFQLELKNLKTKLQSKKFPDYTEYIESMSLIDALV